MFTRTNLNAFPPVHPELSLALHELEEFASVYDCLHNSLWKGPEGEFVFVIYLLSMPLKVFAEEPKP